MTGIENDGQSLANGIPAKHISPETGSFGNATETNRGETSEGVNEASDNRPAAAAGLGADVFPDATSEDRSFASRHGETDDLSANDDGVESAGRQIADGGDRLNPDKRRD